MPWRLGSSHLSASKGLMLPAVAYTLEVPKALHGLSCACPLSQFLLMDLCTSQHDIGESLWFLLCCRRKQRAWSTGKNSWMRFVAWNDQGKTCKHCFFGGAKKDKTHGIARKASAPGGWLWGIKPVLNPTLPWLCLGNGNQCVHALLTAQSCLDVSICGLQSLTFAYWPTDFSSQHLLAAAPLVLGDQTFHFCRHKVAANSGAFWFSLGCRHGLFQALNPELAKRP